MTSTKLTLKVQPKARDNSVVGYDETGVLKVRVTSAPTDGKANKAVTDLLAQVLGLRKRSVTIEHGQTSRTKIVRIDGISQAELSKKLS